MKHLCQRRCLRPFRQLAKKIYACQSGAALPLTAAFLAASLFTMAISVDFGRVFAVKGELQRAADAAALAAALRLVIPPGGIAGLQEVTPDCSRSQAAGTAMTAANPVEAQTIDSLDIQVGTWNGQEFTPMGCDNPYALNAVQATSHKSTHLVFGGLISNNPLMTFSARAVALTGPVSEMPSGAFPLAIDRSAVPSCGQEVFIGLNPSPEDKGCWHTFDDKSPGANDLRNLVNGTTPAPPLKVGDCIRVKEGVSNSVGKELENQLAARGGTWTVVLPVIPDGSHTGWKEVLGFAPFRITGVVTKGGRKGVKGITLNHYATPIGVPGGPVNYGLWASFPRLVR